MTFPLENRAFLRGTLLVGFFGLAVFSHAMIGADPVELVIETDPNSRVRVPARKILDLAGLERIATGRLALTLRGQSSAFELEGGQDGYLDRGDTFCFDANHLADWHTRRMAFFLRISDVEKLGK